MDIIALIIGIASGLVAGVAIVLIVKSLQKSAANTKAKNIITEAEEKADRLIKTAKLDARDEMQAIKHEAQQEINARKQEVTELENKIAVKESKIDAKIEMLDHQKEQLEKRKEDIHKLEVKLSEQLQLKITELERISAMSQSEAREQIMNSVKEQMQNEITAYIKDEEEKAEMEAERMASNIIAIAIEKYSRDVVSHATTSTISIPSDDVKGRIIGREGRNIRTIEQMTGVDILIDDTPEVITISCFNPVRREVAKRAIEALIADGRIQPGRIEELVEKSQGEVDKIIMQKGEQAVFDLGIGKVSKELIKLIGTLHFRTSYGQNALNHSLEVAHLSGVMAAELGQDQRLAKRAGLLHDIGKALDIEQEGSHVELGAALCRKLGENEIVINGIECHHGNKPPISIISILVTAADALSASRPGARSNSAENYIQRIAELENLATNFAGVDQAFAIKAGREIRVMVKPGEVDDLGARALAREIKEKIQSDLTYPGTIKVNVIRELRATEEAL